MKGETVMNNNRIGYLRYWCQKILPLVYDNSLSYYELLCKIERKLNEVIKNVNAIPDYIDEAIDARLSDEHITELIGALIREIENAISANNEEENTNSQHDYAVGDVLWWKNKFYRVIQKIDASDMLMVNTNIKAVSFDEMFKEFLEGIEKDITEYDNGWSPTAITTYPKGTWLWIADKLYRTKSEVIEGNAFVYTGQYQNVEEITIYGMLLEEINARIEGDESLAGDIADEQEARIEAVSDEATARIEADDALGLRIDGVVSDLADEVLAREGADSTLQDNIDAEALAREGADGTLQDNIDAEALAREQADLALGTRIDNLAGSARMTTPEQFGAVGDGVADDTLAVQAAINDGITNGKMVLLTNTYLCNTLLVNNTVEICGGGTIKTPPFRYDYTTSVLNNTNRYFTTAHPEYYHPNTFITIGNWQALVVTRVDGDKIYVAPTYVENNADNVDTKASGSKVSIHKQGMWIAKQNTYSSAVLPVIKNVSIHDISIIGDQSNYSLTNETVMDYRQNAHISAYSCEQLSIENCYFSTCQTNCVGVYGIQHNARINGNVIEHVHVANPNTAMDYIETAGGICFHYDSRFVVATNASTYSTVSNNIIRDCSQGIFLSASAYSTISDNVIDDCDLRGIMLYYGDYQFINRNNVCCGNIITNCGVGVDGNNFGAITVMGAFQTNVTNNNILQGTTGILLVSSEDVLIESNVITATGTGVYHYSGNSTRIIGNTFNSSGNQHVLIYDHDSDGGIIDCIGNTHKGTPAMFPYYFRKGKHITVSNCHISRDTLTRFCTVDTNDISAGDVVVMDCYVSQGIASTTTEGNLLKYKGCVTSAYGIVGNIT